MQDDVHPQGAVERGGGRAGGGEAGGSGARIVPRPDPALPPLTPPWFEAMHEKRDELAKQLDGNLKQLKRVMDEAKWISKQLEEVLEEIRTAGEDYTSSDGKSRKQGKGSPGGRGEGRWAGGEADDDQEPGAIRSTRWSKARYGGEDEDDEGATH